MNDLDAVKEILGRIYGEDKGGHAFDRIVPLIKRFTPKKGSKEAYFSQEDVVLITYGDNLSKEGENPLQTFHSFVRQYLKGAISTVHFLPFFPYSSDDGFSVIDFFSINPEVGTWQDVDAIESDVGLMFDYVLNHFSSKSRWFENYLEAKDGYADFAIEVDPSTDLSMVTRPRALPLLTPYVKTNGATVHVWTTFSFDQIDFNFKSLNVLEKMVEVLLFYVEKGARIVRMDAIAYLWKEIGTLCIHLPQTHDMVKLFRKILDIVAPEVMIITETNVPHDENVSYFGNGRDEAQMVYNFTLPPLLFYAFAKEDATALSLWAKGLALESNATTFFNFTASHDGIGVRPLEGILPPVEIEWLAQIVQANDGQVSSKRNPDGTESPYELNITYVDAILADRQSARAEKFLASQAVQYSLPGVPATYIHSLIGSRNWLEGVRKTQRARSINREKLHLDSVVSELKDPGSFRAKVFFPYLHLIKIRTRQSAFHPNAGFEVLSLDPRLFAIKRTSSDQTLFALINISSRPVHTALSEYTSEGQLRDLLSDETLNTKSIDLAPYRYVWLS